MELHDEHAAAIGRLNDAFRSTFRGGQVFLTRGVSALDEASLTRLLASVQTSPIDPGDDPYGEHDFGALEHDGVRYFWKIDCHGRGLATASPNVADPAVTCRVLTVMRADEY